MPFSGPLLDSQTTQPATTQPAWGKPSNGLSLKIETDKTVYAPGEPIKIKVSYRNHTDKPLELWSYRPTPPMSHFPGVSSRVLYTPVLQPSGLVLVLGGRTIQARLPSEQIPPSGVRVQWLTIDPANPHAKVRLTWGLKPGRHQLYAVAFGWGLRRHWVGAAVSNRTACELAPGLWQRARAIGPHRPGFDAEAIRQRLAKAVGGDWVVRAGTPPYGASVRGRIPAPAGAKGKPLQFTIQDTAAPVRDPFLTSSTPLARSSVWVSDECRVIAEGAVDPVVTRKVVEAIAGPPPAVNLPSADAGLVASGGDDLWADTPPRGGLAGLKRLRVEVGVGELDSRFRQVDLVRKHVQARLTKDLPQVSLAGEECDWRLRVDLRDRTADAGRFWENRGPWGRMLECRLRVEGPCLIDGRRSTAVVFAHSQPVVAGPAIRPSIPPSQAAAEWALDESLKAFIKAWGNANP